MQEIVHAFGIDWRLIVIQIFNFSLLLALLWYFLYRPVMNMLGVRQKKIEQGVKDAEEASQKLTHADLEKKEIVSGAHADAEGIVARARDYAEEKGAEILSQTQEKSARLLTEAEEKAQEIERRAKKESEEEVARLAILGAEKILREKNTV